MCGVRQWNCPGIAQVAILCFLSDLQVQVLLAKLPGSPSVHLTVLPCPIAPNSSVFASGQWLLRTSHSHDRDGGHCHHLQVELHVNNLHCQWQKPLLQLMRLPSLASQSCCNSSSWLSISLCKTWLVILWPYRTGGTDITVLYSIHLFLFRSQWQEVHAPPHWHPSSLESPVMQSPPLLQYQSQRAFLLRLKWSHSHCLQRSLKR